MFPGAKRVIKFVIGVGAIFAAAIFVGPRTEASFGGFLSAQVTGPNQITVYYNDTVTNNDPTRTVIWAADWRAIPLPERPVPTLPIISCWN